MRLKRVGLHWRFTPETEQAVAAEREEFLRLANRYREWADSREAAIARVVSLIGPAPDYIAAFADEDLVVRVGLVHLGLFIGSYPYHLSADGPASGLRART